MLKGLKMNPETMKKKVKYINKKKQLHESLKSQLIKTSISKKEKFLKSLHEDVLPIVEYWNTKPFIKHRINQNSIGASIQEAMKAVNFYLKNGIDAKNIKKRIDNYEWISTHPLFKFQWSKFKPSLIVFMRGLEFSFPNHRFKSTNSSIVWFNECASKENLNKYLIETPKNEKLFYALRREVIEKLGIKDLTPSEHSKVVSGSNKLQAFATENGKKLTYQITDNMWVRYLVESLSKKYGDRINEFMFNVLYSEYTYTRILPTYMKNYHEMMSDEELSIIKRKHSVQERLDELNRK